MSIKWYTSDSRAEPENEPVPSFPPKRTPVSPESVIWAAAGCSGCHSTHHKRKVPMNENISVCLAFKDHKSVNPSLRAKDAPHTALTGTCNVYYAAGWPTPSDAPNEVCSSAQSLLAILKAMKGWKSARNYIMAGIWHDGKADCKREGFSRDIYMYICDAIMPT